ncbi:Protein of unknown function [Pyronema omphalodes CBS 100304]|uniref:Uncharacterized protein n=1 Tax=Pyronema omphalodes (strain CBS 100304) TaxID=1076935 RepID=U4LSF1_PYROM|nr:Protein of unknown function [Pyronema omphalodes CBS 100304]
MKFFILAIAASLIPAIGGSPVATDVAIKRRECAETSMTNAECKPRWNMMFKRKVVFEGKACKHGDFCFGTNCVNGICRRKARAINDDCIHGDFCVLTVCRNGKCITPPQ